jgi:phenylalanyl-tRNA synthetase alpha chain
LSSALHPLEKKILLALDGSGAVSFDRLAALTGLSPDQLRRALQWLTSRGLAQTSESSTKTIRSSGLPPAEVKLVDSLPRTGSIDLSDLKAGFESDSEFSAALGRARGSGWVEMTRLGDKTVVRLLDPMGAEAIRLLLASISEGRDPSTFGPDEAKVASDLLRRGLATETEVKTMTVSMTPSGATALRSSGGAEALDRISTESLASGSWRGAHLRPIDVQAPAPVLHPGRRHPVRDFIREVREAYISMGFSELSGPSVQPAFWNFDALFIPQDHPGREMQDTFYIRGSKDATIRRAGVVANVAATHENGWTTGSRGWRYRWSVEEARRLVLRTHNTVLSVRALSESGDGEARVFAVSKVYRNENLDYKHLAEFYQMDGIIMGKGLNCRHLLGFLTEFYKKLGMKDVKIWPTYFPYTEPSLEIVGYSKTAGDWVELGGSGVFRPEVTRPMGVSVPVLAWGPGIERLMLLRFGLDDLRELYSTDLGWLRRRAEYAGR